MDSTSGSGASIESGPAQAAGEPQEWLPDGATLLALTRPQRRSSTAAARAGGSLALASESASASASATAPAQVIERSLDCAAAASHLDALAAWLLISARLLSTPNPETSLELLDIGRVGLPAPARRATLSAAYDPTLTWSAWRARVEQACCSLGSDEVRAALRVGAAGSILWRTPGAPATPGGADLELRWLAGAPARLVAAFDADRVDADGVRALLDCVATVLAHACDACTAQSELRSIELLAADDRAALRSLGQGPRVSIADDDTLDGLFDAQVLRTPAAVALVADTIELTYEALQRRSHAFAAALSARGVEGGAIVALALDRSVAAVVAMLGIARIGATYLPLDLRAPQQRNAKLVSDAGVACVVIAEGQTQDFGGCPTISVPAVGPSEAVALHPRVGDSRARVGLMYSSGSTGEPKGIAIPHRAIIRLVRSAGFMRLGPGERILQAAPLGFDASTLEIWGPLLNGGCCVIHGEAVAGPAGLQQTIARGQVTGAWLTAALFNSVVDDRPAALAPLRQLVIGGEALSIAHVARVLEAAPELELINGYGPTENTTFTTTAAISRDDAATRISIPIGRPINNTDCLVLGPDRRLLPKGLVGELYVGGDGLALGYYRAPAATDAKFIIDAVDWDARWYRTGDLVRWLPDGRLDYVGRADTQVKIRGFRIELSGIEAELVQLPGVTACAVVAHRHPVRGTELYGYLVGPAQGDLPALREALAARVPDYMVPGEWIALPALPLTGNGKLDRRALPMPERKPQRVGVAHAVPIDAIERRIAEVFAQVLGLERVGRSDHFFELGGNSLLAVRALDKLNDGAAVAVSIAALYGDPTVRGVAAVIHEAIKSASGPVAGSVAGSAAGAAAGSAAASASGSTRSAMSAAASNAAPADVTGSFAEPIAIIGMAGRFPGAGGVDELWDNLLAGRDTIRHFSAAELDASVPAELRADSAYVAARGVLDGIDQFDAAFFGINPREAELMDPQQRVFLEICWECLERAGERPAGEIGVFGGMNNATYFQRHVSAHPQAVERVGEFPVMLANEKDYVALRTANKLNLKGPAVSINTACSTSLVAIGQAVDSLRAGHCDMALAGGVSITCPPNSGYLYQEGSMLSPDGRTRSFSSDARGTVFSDGAAVVLLKPLSRALADGNRVFAVIRSVALNNDGGEKASFTAPSVDGQQRVINAALRRAGVDAAQISYVEAHGTATPLGDPIEVEALRRAYRQSTALSNYCGIGSIKSNVGHLVMAAGAAGVIKTALALEQERIPATLHFDAPNPKIDFSQTPFSVVAREQRWPRGTTPRLAGVSSFGVGGTNAHAILEEAPVQPQSPAATGTQLLQLSARTPAALNAAALRLADHLERAPETNLADAAHTLRVGRAEFAHRLAIVAASTAEASASLRDIAGAAREARAVMRSVGDRAPSTIWMFPGQGSQYQAMGQRRIASDPAFRAAFDECIEALGDVGRDVRAILENGGNEALNATAITQPATFCIEYALARAWQAAGVVPGALIGHSIGEFAAAVIADVMTLQDAAQLVARRGALMQALPRGSMLSVRMAASVLEPLLPKGLGLAAINAPQACVVAGPTAELQAFAATLEQQGAVTRLLRTSHAFHSPMMDPAVAPFETMVRRVPLQAPRIPIYSTLHGRLLDAADAVDPAYWSQHLRAPVRFSQALRAAVDAADSPLLLEVGPRAVLSALARQHATKGTPMPPVVASLGEVVGDEDSTFELARGLLWTLGVPARLGQSAITGVARRRIVLPTYPFERKRFWVDTAAALAAPAVAISPPDQSSSAGSIVMSATAVSRVPRLIASLRDVFEDTSGLDLADANESASFVELGLDSLMLTQVALQLKRRFAVPVTFRQLMESLRSFDALAEHLDRTMPPDPAAAAPVAAAVTTTAGAAPVSAPAGAPAPSPASSAPAGIAAAQVAAAPAAAAMPVAFAAPVAFSAPMMPVAMAPAAAYSFDAANAPLVQQIIAQQMQVLSQQLALLTGMGHAGAAAAVVPAPVAGPVAAAVPVALAAPASAPMATLSAPAAAPVASGASAAGSLAAAAPAAASAAAAAAAAPSDPSKSDIGAKAVYDVKKAFGAIARIRQQDDELTDLQRARLGALIRRYVERTRTSKEFTQKHRGHLADPRVVNGFSPKLKEMIYQIVMERSKGAHLWDLDGNRYVDVLNGFGMSLFGWQPDFVLDAVRKQLDAGYEIGPMHPLAGEVAELICEMTGFERAALCNTGSEAVMAAVRIARTVTGRDTLVLFAGSYHGTFDEVVVRSGKAFKGVPAAPGIMPGVYGDVRVLDYGTPESLEYIRTHADDIAAVLCEPVQSRRPDFQPREYLKELRAITAEHGACLIFDEVITGFRTQPGGVQALFGIQGDLATYGKVIGGGYPVGVVAGRREFMDALDGGSWQYGDDSVPTVGVTYFAGTFVRHPLALAACKASLLHMKEAGPELQQQLNVHTAGIADELNAYCREVGAPIQIKYFASLFRVAMLEEHPLQDLLFAMMRTRGVHILDNFPCFLTTAHTNEDIALIKTAFKESVAELQASDFLPKRVAEAVKLDASRPPVPDARLGRGKDGKPAWYVPDPQAAGRYKLLAV